MKDSQVEAMAFGLSYLSEQEMREILFTILTDETDGHIESAIEFVFNTKTLITNTILKKLREKKEQLASLPIDSVSTLPKH